MAKEASAHDRFVETALPGGPQDGAAPRGAAPSPGQTIYERVEQAIDATEHVADVLEGILVKQL
jgi:hypothetical protein